MQAMNKVFIYGLYDPRNGELRYIGKAKCLKTRLFGHMTTPSLKQNHHRAHWLRQLDTLGLRPEIKVIEETAERKWQERERHWINHFRNLGANLTNTTEGGEGGATCRGKKWTEERRAHMSAKLKGHPVSKETRAKIRARQINIRQTNNGWNQYNKIEIDESTLLDLYLEQRKTSYQIAAQLGIHAVTIQRRLKKLGVTRSNSESHKGKSKKLLPEHVREIRELSKAGLSQRKIAARFNVNRITIYEIQRGKSWTQVA